jgi:hypothetical protein
MTKQAMGPMGGGSSQDTDSSHRETAHCKTCGGAIYKVNDGSPEKYAWQHDIEQGAGVPHQAYPGGVDQQVLAMLAILDTQAKATKPVGEMTEEEYAAHKERTAKDKVEGEKWNRRHPVRIKHIVDHWNEANEDEVKAGLSWYEDSHHLARHVANDTGHPLHVVAGLLANYSPQTHWATNIHTAARVARTRKAEGGPGSGVMASTNQRKAAERILNGEHYDKVLSGPKIRAFAHLIEHGGNLDDDHDRVVVDRHALSVACGARATDVAYTHSKLGTKGRYDHVSEAYRKAAKRISKQIGTHVSPHQVQAVTWIVRQRKNEAEDIATAKSASSGTAVIARQAIEKWNEYAGEHHPALLGKIPGTGYSEHDAEKPEDIQHTDHLAAEGKTVNKKASLRAQAYGEVKAPADVDTLRESECPVCGNDESWDGDRCMVCGFFRPPQMFLDPNTEIARQVDLRQEQTGQTPSSVPDEFGPAETVGAAPSQANDGGGMTLQQSPVDPADLTEDGLVGNAVPDQPDLMGVPTQDQVDPNGIADADAQSAANDALVPGPMGMDGQPKIDLGVDPNAADRHFNQGGEPFTPGPNAPFPAQFAEPMAPVDAEQINEDGTLPGEGEPDGQQPGAVSGGEPGTPGDGVPDLACQNCGFESEGQQPMSQGDSPMDPAGSGDGLLEGDVCPNCQKGLMASISGMMSGGPVG